MSRTASKHGERVRPRRERAVPSSPIGDRPGRELVQVALMHAHVTGLIGSLQHTATNGYLLEPRTLADYNLIYLWEGEARWVVGEVAHDLSPGHLLVVPPGQRHHARSRSRDMTFGSVHVLAQMPGGRDLLDLFTVPHLRRVEPGCHLDRIFRLAMEEYQVADESISAMIAPWSELVLKALLRHDAAAGSLRISGDDPVVAGMLRLMAADLARRWSLTELAQRAGYAAQHLNRRFQRALGATPLECLRDLRWQRACRLLREGRLTIHAIGEAVGYPDPAYFSRRFQARFQRSPSDYRSQSSSGSSS